MTFDPIMAETRFGCGLSPMVAPPEDMDAMMRGVVGPDRAAATYPIEHSEDFLQRLVALRTRRKAMREAKGTESEAERRKEVRQLVRGVRSEWLGWLTQSMLRQATTPSGFRERLVGFWGDHFTTKGKRALLDRGYPPYVESAIRPNLSGSFADLLIATVTHPMMLHFLDQDRSIGPNSKVAKRKGERRGLNENLAREILELHTLGVDGPYTQGDVRQLAELLTGLFWNVSEGTQYRQGFAEPGAERILGKWYGAQQGTLADIHSLLRDLARHPATARHIAWKLAVHFVSDTPPDTLVAAIEAAYLETNGDLTALYRAMLTHPAAWHGGGNFKQPLNYMGSAFRALALTGQDVETWNDKRIQRNLSLPLQIMGQPWEGPAGPDGWAEEDGQWATPQGLAARLQWALRLPEMLPRGLPDPRDFVHDALGPTPPQRVVFAAEAAENRREGVALVLVSPAFQRQ